MSIDIDPFRSVLILVDIQPDFMPGGRLAVADGHAIVAPIAALLGTDRFAVIVATQDWHPRDHISFVSQHPGRQPFESITLHGHPQTLWPDHCVQGTAGAAIHPELPTTAVELFVRKGMERETDSYSAFRNNWNAAGERPPTGLAGYLRERSVAEVYICGLARDVCVKWTAEDANEFGFATRVLWDLTRPVDPDQDEATRAGFETAGIEVLDSESIAGILP